MDEEISTGIDDLSLGYLLKQDLYDLSVEDLKDRIENMRTEIVRCQALIEKRGSSMAAAESLFKS